MRILIVDDHELVRKGVCSLLRERPDFEICGEGVDGHDAIDKARQLHPDVIVMDISMPGLNGLDATREIRGILPYTQILVLSQHNAPQMMRQALNAGARGYVVKSAIPAELVTAIETVGRGQLFFDSAIGGKPESEIDVHEVLRRSMAFENALRESEERFRLTFEQAAVGMAHVAPEGHWLRVNQKLCEIMGYTQEEMLALTFQALTYPPDLPADLELLARVVAGEINEYILEKRYIRKDGRMIWGNLTVSAVRDPDGMLKYCVSVVEDITARKEAESGLDETARQQKALFHLAEELLRTGSIEEIYDAAFRAIFAALQCDRASILLCDETDVMRFRAWRGLSEKYRHAVDGHSAWKPGEKDPRPVCVTDIELADLGDELKSTVHQEGIGALAFIPLVSNGKLIGKFMTYFNTTHEFSEEEIDLSLTIARQLAFGIDHRKSAEALRQSEDRFRTLAMQLDSEVRVRTAELEQRNADVMRQTEQLRELSWRLLRMQDEERRHIARELHDSAGQTLTVLGIHLANLAQTAAQTTPEIAESVTQVSHLVQQLTREIRTTSYLLHPPLLDENGLPAALSWYVRGLAERSGLEIDFRVSEEFGRLPQELELAVFRLVQECLTNIHRHSGSKSAIIQFAREPDRVLVEVRDRGKGIPREKLSEIMATGSGVGIRGMRERVRQFHGEMIIDSNSAGTTIIVTFPLSPEASKPSRAAAHNFESAV